MCLNAFRINEKLMKVFPLSFSPLYQSFLCPEFASIVYLENQGIFLLLLLFWVSYSSTVISWRSVFVFSRCKQWTTEKIKRCVIIYFFVFESIESLTYHVVFIALFYINSMKKEYLCRYFIPCYCIKNI